MINYIRAIENRNWAISIVLACIIPIFPEYLAPLFAMISFIFLIKYANQKGIDIKVGIIGKIVLAYIAYITIGLFYTNNFMSTLATSGMWIVMFLIYLSVYNIIIDKRRFQFLILAITITAGIVGGISIIQHYAHAIAGSSNVSFWSFIDEKIMSMLNSRIKYEFPGNRMASTFNNPNILSAYLIMVFPFAASFLLMDENKSYRKIAIISFFAISAGIAFSFSRGGYLALITMVIVFLVFDRNKRYTVAAISISGFLLLPGPVISRLFSIGSVDKSVSARIDAWVVGLKFINDNPILGKGAGVMNIWDILKENGINIPHMHNLVLQITAEGGLIALAFFALALIVSIKNIAYLFTLDESCKKIGVLTLAFIAGFLVIGLFDFPLMTPKLVGTFLMIAAIIDKNTDIRIPAYSFDRSKLIKVKISKTDSN